MKQVYLILAGMVASAMLLAAQPSNAQSVATYGAEFLASGVGARALGMGGAHVALSDDVTAGYWNPAGLSRIDYPEIGYMHVERFSGAVTFDYGGAALPLNEESTLAITVVRSGVNDIANTLNAWDVERQQPKPDYLNRIRRFSAADYAFYGTYARKLGENLSAGISGKVVRRSIGDFAEAWGYSVDASMQYQRSNLELGITLQDLTTMLQSWSVNPDAFNEAITTENPQTGEPYTFEETFGQDLPEGGTELVLPVIRLGSGYHAQATEDLRITAGLDLDIFVDGPRAYAPNLGDVSMHPRGGVEVSFRELVAVRGGIMRVQQGGDLGWDATPTVGAGVNLQQISLDYSFGDFA